MCDRTNKLNLNGIYNLRSDKIVLPRNININYLDKEIFHEKIEERTQFIYKFIPFQLFVSNASYYLLMITVFQCTILRT